MIANTFCRVLDLSIEEGHDHENLRASERRIVRKGGNGVKENIAIEMENRNKTDKPLSPDLLRRIEKIQASHDDNFVIDDQGIRRSLPEAIINGKGGDRNGYRCRLQDGSR